MEMTKKAVSNKDKPLGATASQSPRRKAPLAPSSQPGTQGGAGFKFENISTRPAQRPQSSEVARGGFAGSPSALPYRSEMEQWFGRDFSSVRAFTGQKARSAASALGAEAYTVGPRIAFAHSNPDRGTVAHELTHVVQQQGGTPRSVATKSVQGPGPGSMEAEADAVERAVRGGDSLPAISGQQPGTLAKKTAPPTQQKSADLSPWLSKLSQVRSFVAANDILGGMFRTIAPNPGNSAFAKFNLNFYFTPVLPGGIPIPIQLGISCELEVVHTDEGMELGGLLALLAGLGKEVETYFGTVKAHLLLRGALGVKAKADDAFECMRLIGLAIDHELRTIAPVSLAPGYELSGTDVANALFGAGYAKSVVANMDIDTASVADDKEADKVEYVAELGVQTGFSYTPKDEEEELGAEAKMSAGYRRKSELGRTTAGLEDSLTTGYYAKAEFKVGEVGCELSVFSGKNQNEPVQELEAMIDIPVPAKNLHAMADSVWQTFGVALQRVLSRREVAFNKTVEDSLYNALMTTPRAVAVGTMADTKGYAPSVEFKLEYNNKDGVTLRGAVVHKQKLAFEKWKSFEGEVGFKSKLFAFEKIPIRKPVKKSSPTTPSNKAR